MGHLQRTSVRYSTQIDSMVKMWKGVLLYLLFLQQFPRPTEHLNLNFCQGKDIKCGYSLVTALLLHPSESSHSA